VSIRTTVCLAVSWAFVPDEDVGPNKRKNPAALFGLLLSEPPIVRDYLAETMGKLVEGDHPTVGTDWWDSGRRPDYAGILREWNGMPRPGTKLPIDMSYPDLLTHRGLLLAFTDIRTGLPSEFGAGMRDEFYEIKPASRSGKQAGRRKARKLDKFYKDNGLPYKRGVTYPRKKKKLPLLAFDDPEATKTCRYLLEVRRRQFQLQKLDVWLEIEQPQNDPGLIFYELCIEMTRDEEIEGQIALEMARNIVRVIVRCAAHGHAKAVADQLLVAVDGLEPAEGSGITETTTASGSRGSWRIPRPQYDVECVDGIKPMAVSMADAMYSRGAGLPGEQYLLACDEFFFTNQVIDKSTAERARQYMQVRPSPQFLYVAAGRSLFARVKPFIELSAEFEARAANAWYHSFPRTRNDPVEMVMTVGFLVIAAAGLVALGAEVALPRGIAALFEGLLPAPGSVMMPEAVLADAVGAEAATGTGVPGSLAAARSAPGGTRIVMQKMVRVGVQQAPEAAEAVEETIQETQMARRALALPLPLGRDEKQGSKLDAIGITLMIASRTAYAAPPGASPSGPPPARPSGKPIGFQLGRLYTIRFSGLLPYDIKSLPGMYDRFDALRLDADAPAFRDPNAGPPPKQEARYLGRIVVR